MVVFGRWLFWTAVDVQFPMSGFQGDAFAVGKLKFSGNIHPDQIAGVVHFVNESLGEA